VKKLVKASSLEELQSKGCQKLGIDGNSRMETLRIETLDGYEIDDDCLQELPPMTEVVFLIGTEQVVSPATPHASVVPAAPATPPFLAASATPAAEYLHERQPWPTVYSLPRMSAKLQEQLDKVRVDPSCGADFKLQAKCVNELLSAIMCNVFETYKSNEDPYLTSVQIRDICVAITQAYPGLRDDSADGQKFWRVKICRRLKERRSKILPEFVSPKVLETRQKHGRQGRKRRHPDEYAEQLEDQERQSGGEVEQLGDEEGQHEGDEGQLGDEEGQRGGDEGQLGDQHQSGGLTSPKTPMRVVADDTVSVIARSITFGDCEDFDVPRQHEAGRRKLNSEYQSMPLGEVLAAMQESFSIRCVVCLNKTVKEELQLYRPLQLYEVIMQEAILMAKECNSVRTGDYLQQDSAEAIAVNICTALDVVWKKRAAFKNFKFCKQFVNGDCSGDESLAAAVCLLLGRLRVDPEIIFSDELPVRVLRLDNKWTGVVINGATLNFNSLKRTVVVFIVSFLAFNLQHIKVLESFLETIEVLSKLRRRCAVSRVAAATLLDAMR
jgi:hypothetical protein